MIKMNVFSAGRKRFSPWWFGLKVGIVGAILVWWWLQNQLQESVPAKVQRVVLPEDKAKETPPAVSPPPTPKTKQAAPARKDDLTRISGIGPKSAALLKKAGITAFTQLMQMTPEEIQDLFRAEGGRAPDASDWPRQAREFSKA